MEGSNLSEDCEDEESFMRKPVTIGKETSRREDREGRWRRC
jgi:hypothetical protein